MGWGKQRAVAGLAVVAGLAGCECEAPGPPTNVELPAAHRVADTAAASAAVSASSAASAVTVRAPAGSPRSAPHPVGLAVYLPAAVPPTLLGDAQKLAR